MPMGMRRSEEDHQDEPAKTDWPRGSLLIRVYPSIPLFHRRSRLSLSDGKLSESHFILGFLPFAAIGERLAKFTSN